jgi:tRNA 2-thiouridine synthesizing protein A
MEDEILDVRGLKCPLPALLTRRRLARGRAGMVLLVIADDPMARIDVPFMCHGEGIEVLEIVHAGSESRMTLRKPEV